jgi:glycosyltransferase involved in cell wall biosynthesis
VNAGIRILFVTQYVDHILFFFLCDLARRADVLVLFEAENDWTRALGDNGVRAVRAVPRSRFDHRFQAQVERMYRAWPWDVIQSFHGNAQLANLIQWNIRKLPLVGYRAYIGHLKFRQNPCAYWSVRNPHLAAVAAVSGAVKEYLEGFRILRPRNVHVISHGINRAWVDAQKTDHHDLRAKLGLAGDAFIVLSMASLRPYKHFEVIVSAAKMLEGYPIHFVHAGDAKRWADKASANIHFLGHQNKPFPILAAADIFVSTSHNEAFGRSNLEAMACGKPLIGSRTGGLLDLIEDGVTGRFFESCDARDFADKVLFYYRDREAVKAHGAAAIERVADRFATEVMVRQYVDLYRSVRSRPRRQGWRERQQSMQLTEPKDRAAAR